MFPIKDPRPFASPLNKTPARITSRKLHRLPAHPRNSRPPTTAATPTFPPTFPASTPTPSAPPPTPAPPSRPPSTDATPPTDTPLFTPHASSPGPPHVIERRRLKSTQAATRRFPPQVPHRRFPARSPQRPHSQRLRPQRPCLSPAARGGEATTFWFDARQINAREEDEAARRSDEGGEVTTQAK
jgi:hypothetical protein